MTSSSQFCKYLFKFKSIQYINIQMTCSINDKEVFSPSQIFDKFELTFKL